jgi:hypothetical protein
MRKAAENLEFEEAARLRDEVKRLEAVELAIADDPLARQSVVEEAVEARNPPTPITTPSTVPSVETMMSSMDPTDSSAELKIWAPIRSLARTVFSSCIWIVPSAGSITSAVSGPASPPGGSVSWAVWPAGGIGASTPVVPGAVSPVPVADCAREATGPKARAAASVIALAPCKSLNIAVSFS